MRLSQWVYYILLALELVLAGMQNIITFVLTINITNQVNDYKYGYTSIQVPEAFPPQRG